MNSQGPFKFTIDGKQVGDGCRTYIIAELSGNHQHDFKKAVDLIHAAKEANVDAVKLQTYTADTLTIASNKKSFCVTDGPWKGQTLHELYQKAYTPWEWQPELKKIAEGLGLSLFSTPFDVSSLEFLKTMGVSAYKIASFELNDLELLRAVARQQKPIILSTGMASDEEILESLEAIRLEGTGQVILLKCTSAYPAQPRDMNLRRILALKEKFGIPVGLSDHTLGTEVAVAAVALGACCIEKHLTLSRFDKGPDSAFSLEPREFSKLVQAVRNVEQAFGDGQFRITPDEEKSRVFRRSLFVVKNIREGEKFTRENVRSIRPGNGLAPKFLDQVLRGTARADLEAGTPLSWDVISETTSKAKKAA